MLFPRAIRRLAVALCVVLPVLLAAPAEAAARPNVIVLMTDDQTVEDMSAMPLTSDLLGGEGVTFDRSYVSYPVCCPARATFFSGQYAHNHGVMGLYPPTGGYARFDRFNALPVWLQDAGYVTAHIGKYMNGYGSQVPADVPPGWTEWYGAVDGSTYRMWGYTLNENGELRTYGTPYDEDPRLYQTDVYGERAVDFIARRAPSDKPFFLSVSFLAPHHETGAIRAQSGKLVRAAPRHTGALSFEPLRLSPAFDEVDLSDKPGFVRRRGQMSALVVDGIAKRYHERQESLMAVDEAVDAIVTELRTQGELDDTYIMLTSDNGYMQGEHGVPSGKMLPYDPSTRVPLLLRGPGIPPGQVSHALVGNIDLAPTILNVADAQPGKALDGRTLIPFALDPGLRTARPLLHETGGERYVSGPEQDFDGMPAVRRLMSYHAVRTRRWLWVEYRGGARELYDTIRDPYELRSLHREPSHQRVRAALHRVLVRLERCTGDSCRRPAVRIPKPRPERRKPAVAKRRGSAVSERSRRGRSR